MIYTYMNILLYYYTLYTFIFYAINFIRTFHYAIWLDLLVMQKKILSCIHCCIIATLRRCYPCKEQC